MKTRIISAIVAIGVAIPIFIYGGLVFSFAFYILTILGLREFLKVRENEKSFPDFINSLMEYLKYDKRDYEIDYRKNNLIMAIYNQKKLYSNDF